MKKFLLSAILPAAVLPLCASQTPPPIAEKIGDAWKVSLERFFVSKTNLFYECVSSYENGKWQSHLPSAQEVKRQYPNPCGYATGMEDCAILGGVAISATVDRFAATSDESLKPIAKRIFDGLESLVQPDGFVARGICVEDGKSIYINSSVDQYTHCVHGLWRFFRSPLSDSQSREKAAAAVARVADRLVRNVVKENDFDSLRADGKPCALRISRFTQEYPHVAARLACVYAAAWDMTKNEQYRALWLSEIDTALDVSLKIEKNSRTPIYTFLQMQSSLEILRGVETDSARKGKIDAIMKRVAVICEKSAASVMREFDRHDLTLPYGDWRNPERVEIRNGYSIPKLGQTRRVWRAIRVTGELPLAVAMSPEIKVLPEQTSKLFSHAVEKTDYFHCGSCGALFHYAAFWRIKADGFLRESPCGKNEKKYCEKNL